MCSSDLKVKRNCAILRIESEMIRDLLVSLDKDKRYSEFIVLSPFTKDGIEFSRVLFLDGDYVKRNEKYILSFDAPAPVVTEAVKARVIEQIVEPMHVHLSTQEVPYRGCLYVGLMIDDGYYWIEWPIASGKWYYRVSDETEIGRAHV